MSRRASRPRAAFDAPRPARPAAVRPLRPSAFTLLGDADLHHFNEGTHDRLYEKLGSHLLEPGGDEVFFAVWAPNARAVSVVGDFNGWEPGRSALVPRGSSGIWEGVARGPAHGSIYKYSITPRDRDHAFEKADPFAFHAETPPRTGSIVWDLAYDWQDGPWMRDRGRRNALDAPLSIYEVHLGSWRRVPEQGGRPLNYREMAPALADHVQKMGFTHVELMPVMEHPFYGSWGYQCTGYFAPTSRYGSPQDLMYLIDLLHQRGIGVILDWVPSHFPSDAHGIARFDGTSLFEHEDPRQGFHPDWKSLVFNYGRSEVPAFLISSARFWLDRYHADGLRVDAVASMLYLDYSRRDGEWLPNRHGGRENLEALAFMRRLNETLYRDFPDTQIIAEESTSWPMVSRPTFVGGLGFGLKWDMGWMHDTLRYMGRDPVHRHYHHTEMTFRSLYAFHENFVLPLSHDEVVHGKGSLLSRMPGDDWRKFANLRLLYSWMYAIPGKKLLFMGSEIAPWKEWNHESSIDWHLERHEPHAGVSRLVADLNRLHAGEPALHELDCQPDGFEWIDANDATQSVLLFLRHCRSRSQTVLCAFNFTPVVRHGYRAGVPRPGRWDEILNTDATAYGGSGAGNLGGAGSQPVAAHGRPDSLVLTLPPLAAIYLRWRSDGAA